MRSWLFTPVEGNLPNRYALLGALSSAMLMGCSLLFPIEGFAEKNGPTVADADTATPDASIPADGDGGGGSGGRDASDASEPSDASGRPLCERFGSRPLLLCDDFDRPNPLTTWMVGGEDVAVSSTQARSPPSSIRFRTQQRDAGSTGSQIFKRLNPESHLSASWAMRVDNDWSSCGWPNVASIKFSDQQGKHFLGTIQVDQNYNVQFQEYGEPGPAAAPSYSSEVFVGNQTAGTWIHVTMEIDLTSSSGPIANVTLNNAPQPTLQGRKLKAGYGMGPHTDMTVFLGLPYVGAPSGSCAIHIDDVSVERR